MSTAIDDGGIFEFGMNGEDYNPFEGAGAVESEWEIVLPNAFRPFDYHTISDVSIELFYTAMFSEALRLRTDAKNGELDGELGEAELFRMISLGAEFPTEFHRLTSSPLGTTVSVHLDERYLPVYMPRVRTEDVSILLAVSDSDGIASFRMTVDGSDVSEFARRARFGNLFAASAPSFKQRGFVSSHEFAVLDAGALAPARGSQRRDGLDDKRLRDVLVLVQYRKA